MRNNIIFLITFLALSSGAFAQEEESPFGAFMDNGQAVSSSTLDQRCSQPGFACGECESTLQNGFNDILRGITTNFPRTQNWGGDQGIEDRFTRGPENVRMRSSATLDGTLSQIMDLFRAQNPGGDNRLNFVVIGQSESLQATSTRGGVLNPRIMLKSPNSELMVTFNTDPRAAGYQTLEVMRWNGRLGRYEFQEIDFENNRVDLSGSRCMECHKEPSMRPNWDTYRAWAGVIPSRDDMLESHTHRMPGGPTEGVSAGLNPAGGVQPDARAYLGFLDRVAREKERNPRSRLGLLDIPFDQERQLGDYVTAAGRTPAQLSPTEQVAMIRRRISEQGFYRIRHFPDVQQSSAAGLAVNLDSKTAPYAGPSQMAFDQMSAQNMCRVVTDLRTHKDFNKFGKSLALLFACREDSSSLRQNLDDVYPPEFQQRILSHYNTTNFKELTNLEAAQRPKEPLTTLASMRELVNLDTSNSHRDVDTFKFARHGNLLRNYLTNVERVPARQAAIDAQFFTEAVRTPTQTNFHAIEDPGGVRGVAENSGALLSEARLLLENFGVPVNQWSLARGRDNAYNSFSFSDQFGLLATQPLWREMKEAAGGCENLATQARAALSGVTPPVRRAQSGRIPDPTTFCSAEASTPTTGAQNTISDANFVVTTALLPRVRSSVSKCLTCHDGSQAPEFAGLDKFVNNRGDDEFLNFLSNTRSSLYDRPMMEVLQMKLGLLDVPAGVELGSPMPPSGWRDSAEFAREFEVVPASDSDDVRRRMIAGVLTTVAARKNESTMRSFCEGVNSSRLAREVSTPTTPAVPRAQVRPE